MAEKLTPEDPRQRIGELEKENEVLKRELDECKLIMETLHDSEQHMYAMVACVPGTVYRFEIDNEWTVEYMSDEVSRMTGYPASHFMFNKVTSYRSMIHPDDRERVGRVIKKGIKQAEPFSVEYRIINSNDQIRWCSETGKVIFSADGTPLHLDGTIFDVTDRKSAEDKIQKANQELKRLVSIDSLTQIANRRHFIECLEKEWRRMAREKGVLSLILCDIDFFKLFNDNYGHQEGDRCLCAVAGAINSAVRRPADLVARFGGEEFIVILPNTDLNGAVHVAELIISKIHQLRIPHDYSTVDKYVTLSLGAASVFPNQNIVSGSLIKAADDALYEAKKQGRKRVIMSDRLL